MIVVLRTGTGGIEAGHAAFDVSFPLRAIGVPLYAQWLAAGTGTAWPGALTSGIEWRF